MHETAERRKTDVKQTIKGDEFNDVSTPSELKSMSNAVKQTLNNPRLPALALQSLLLYRCIFNLWFVLYTGYPRKRVVY